MVVEYPFKMAITLETTPHPLLSTQHQLHVKRKIILPDNLVHRLEWRYYLRRERTSLNGKVIDKIGRRMRVGKGASTSTTSRHRGRASYSAPALHAEPITTTARRPTPSERVSGYDGKMLMVGRRPVITVLTPHACANHVWPFVFFQVNLRYLDPTFYVITAYQISVKSEFVKHVLCMIWVQ